jgi:hypothetical protein
MKPTMFLRVRIPTQGRHDHYHYFWRNRSSTPHDANTDFRIGERVRWGMTVMPYPETEKEPSF